MVYRKEFLSWLAVAHTTHVAGQRKVVQFDDDTIVMVLKALSTGEWFATAWRPDPDMNCHKTVTQFNSEIIRISDKDPRANSKGIWYGRIGSEKPEAIEGYILSQQESEHLAYNMIYTAFPTIEATKDEGMLYVDKTWAEENI